MKFYFNILIIFIVCASLKAQDSTITIKINDYYEKADFYLTTKQYDQAKIWFSKIIEIAPKEYMAYFHRGHAELQTGNYFGDINDLTKVIELKPGYAYAFSNRGYAKFMNKDTIGACKDWKIGQNKGVTFYSDLFEKYCK